MRSAVYLMSALAAAVLSGKPAAGVDMNADCHALKLVAASGLPGPGPRSYTFNGICNIITDRPSGPFVEKQVPAEASATWDPAKHEFKETFRVLADFKGVAKPKVDNVTYINHWHIKPLPVTSLFACNDDPLVATAACGVLSHENLSGFAPFSNPAQKQGRPLLKGKTSLAEATKLAAAGQPMTVVGAVSNIAAVTVEAESLIAAKKTRSSAGALAMQPMLGFGPDWGNSAQLFWHGATPGAVLDLDVTVPVAARYRVELYLTRAPDYGDLLIQVGNNPPSASFSGFADTVALSKAVDAGTYDLAAGTGRVSLKLLGKNANSTGYLAGVDRVRLVPVTK